MEIFEFIYIRILGVCGFHIGQVSHACRINQEINDTANP